MLKTKQLNTPGKLAASIILLSVLIFVVAFHFLGPSLKPYGILNPMKDWIVATLHMIILAPLISATFHRLIQEKYRFPPILVTLSVIISFVPAIFIQNSVGAVLLLSFFSVVAWITTKKAVSRTSRIKSMAPVGVIICIITSSLFYTNWKIARFPASGNIAERNLWAKKELGRYYDIAIHTIENSPTIAEDAGTPLTIAPLSNETNRVDIGWLDSGTTELNLEVFGPKAKGKVHIYFNPAFNKINTLYAFDWIPENERWVKPLNEKGELRRDVYRTLVYKDSLKILRDAAVNNEFAIIITEYNRAHTYDYHFYLLIVEGDREAIAKSFQTLGQMDNLFQYYMDSANWFWRTKRNDRIKMTRYLATKAQTLRPNDSNVKELLKSANALQ